MAHRKRNATNGLDVADSINVPLPPGIRNSRSEFRMELIPILGFLHYWIGVLQENAIGIMNFFTGLDLSKSQADSLLNQLADDWQQQHDAIATRTKTRCSSGHDVQEGLLTLIQRQSARCFGNGKQSCCCLKPRFFNTLKRLWSRQVFPVRT